MIEVTFVMIIYEGKAVSEGIAIGKIKVYRRSKQTAKRFYAEDIQAEKERYAAARRAAVSRLQALYEKTLRGVGEAEAKIFEAHQFIVEDKDFIEAVEGMIEAEKVNAEYAVACIGRDFSKMFSEMEDEYFRGRAADITDVTERLISILPGGPSEGMSAGTAENEGVSGVTAENEGMKANAAEYEGMKANAAEKGGQLIIIADDLTPSETVQIDKSSIISFVTVRGSVNSHTSILAKTMNIPAVIGCPVPLSDELNGRSAVVDGYEGRIYIEPEADILAEKERLLIKEKEKKSLYESLKGKENITLDGRKIELYANIGNVKELETALENDAGGIGLFRTEFIYLGSADYPTEDEQFKIYKQAAEAFKGRKVIIRTIDIGADKQADYFDIPVEENPAMGLRAIRICLMRPEIFKAQLRAILRASAFGNISIMFPMIISVDEVKRIKTIVAEVKEELDSCGIAYDKDIELGIMIETPAAVMIADELAEEVDFFSVGTNDLTQYTLAIDRQNRSLDGFFDPHHPAIMRMLKLVVDAAHRHNIWAGICGELAADLSLTKEFLAMGYDELSVSPGKLLPLRKTVLEM